MIGTPIFDDWKSILHMLLGLIAGLLFPPYPAISLTLLVFFTMYEVYTSKSIFEALFDIVEFLIGLLIGILLHYLVKQSIKTYYLA